MRPWLTVLAIVCGASSDARGQAPSEREIHDRIVAIMVRNGVPMTATDTFVTWTSGPILYHAVSRHSDSISVLMVRSDPLAGVATVAFDRGRIASARVQWSRAGTTVRYVTLSVMEDSVIVRDSVRRTFPLPVGVWAVADHGMDDLFVQALSGLAVGSAHTVRVFRPYGVKWDDVSVRVSEWRGGRLIESTDAAGDTTFLVVSSGGVLVQVQQSKNTISERRPLETTEATKDYLRLRRPITRP